MLPAGVSRRVLPAKAHIHVVPAFTLIELLIVVAIILVLISIALPGLMDAQLRASVTKAKGEIRGLGTPMEMYYRDFRIYPARQDYSPGTSKNGISRRFLSGLTWLTTPVKYSFTAPTNPFKDSWTR